MTWQTPPFRLPASSPPAERAAPVTDASALRAMVKHVLQRPEHHQWTLQGFGMLRTYLDDGWRLHVWDEAHAVPGVTTMHDHPWDFDSLVVAGVLVNQRYQLVRAGLEPATHMMRTIKPGVGLKVLEEDQPVQIRPVGAPEVYLAGDRYRQLANEIHVSTPFAGTVTLVHRRRVGEDVARSFYPAGEGWVSGEPRTATPDEARAICALSLAQWFAEPRSAP